MHEAYVTEMVFILDRRIIQRKRITVQYIFCISSVTSVDLCSGGTRFEFRPVYHLFGRSFYDISRVVYRNETSNTIPQRTSESLSIHYS